MIKFKEGPNFGHRQEWRSEIRKFKGIGIPGFYDIARTIKCVDYKIPPICLIEFS